MFRKTLSTCLLLAFAGLTITAGDLEKYQEMASAIETAVHEGDLETLNKFSDTDTFINEIQTNVQKALGLSESDLKDLVSGLREGMGQGVGTLLFQISQGTDFTVVRAEDKGSHGIALGRAVGEAGVNYLELRLTTKGISDIYVYANGSTLSDIITNNAINALQAQPGFLDKITGKKNEWLEFYDWIQKYEQRLANGEGAELLKEFNTFPEKIRYSDVGRPAALNITAQLSEEEYTKTIEELRKRFPNNGAMDLYAIDLYTMKRDWEKAHGAISRLDEKVKDPYLATLHMGIAQLEGDLPAARKYAETLKKHDMHYEFHSNLLDVALTEKKWDEVVTHLQGMEEHGGFTIDPQMLKNEEVFADFVKTDSFTKWEQDHQGEE